MFGGSIVKHFSRVLAAVDFSKPARGAFDYALALSKQHGAELVVVQAVPPQSGLQLARSAASALTAKLAAESRSGERRPQG